MVKVSAEMRRCCAHAIKDFHDKGEYEAALKFVEESSDREFLEEVFIIEIWHIKQLIEEKENASQKKESCKQNLP